MAIGLLPAGQQLARWALTRQGARSVYADVGAHRMHFFDVPGRRGGPTVVLLHGLGGAAIGWSRCMLPLAQSAGRVLVPDLPGSGFSPTPAGKPLDILELTAAVATFLEQEAGGPVTLIGNSLGGAMAVRLASSRPDLVAELVMVAPAGARVSDARFAELLDAFRVRTVSDAQALTRRLFSRAPLLMPLVLGPDLLEMFTRPSVASVLADTSNHAPLAESELSGLTQPTLLLWGRSERLLPYEGIGYFRAHLPPHAEVEEVEGFGHCPQLESPRELVLRLQSFLRRDRSRAAA